MTEIMAQLVMRYDMTLTGITEWKTCKLNVKALTV